MGEQTDVLVVGAGPAGLTAAYALAQASRPVLVIEKDRRYVGGISRTVKHNGFLIDIGGHRFFSKSTQIVELWKELLPDDLLERTRLSRIYYGGKYYSYPLRGFEALRNLGVWVSAACLLSYAWAKLTPIREPRTFHQWVRNAFGEKLFRIFFKTYTEKVWGIPCDRISADWAAQRIKGLDLLSAITTALRRRGWRDGRDQKVIKTLIDRFYYPRRGPGMLWEACAARIAAAGGRILMGHALVSLEWNAASRWWAATVAGPEGTRQFRARHVVSSAPLSEFIEALSPQPRSVSNARKLRYRDFIIVALVVAKLRPLADNWIYIHDSSVKVGRIQNFGAWSPEMVPDEGKSCLGLEYFCFEDDPIWRADDAELIAMAKSEIAKIGLCAATDIVDACVVRQPRAYPVYDEDYRSHVAAIREDVERNFPTLHLVGRNGMHKYNNQDHSMMTALLSARNIVAGRRVYDVWSVNEDAEYQEAGSLPAFPPAQGAGFERDVPSELPQQAEKLSAG